MPFTGGNLEPMNIYKVRKGVTRVKVCLSKKGRSDVPGYIEIVTNRSKLGL